jgi:hypothetical protein
MRVFEVAAIRYDRDAETSSRSGDVSVMVNDHHCYGCCCSSQSMSVDDAYDLYD